MSNLRAKGAWLTIAVLLALVASVGHAGSTVSITLAQATVIAKKSTLFLRVQLIDCKTKDAATEYASAFLISHDGLVVTAGHLFATDGCKHSITAIEGLYDKQSIPAPQTSAPVLMKLLKYELGKADLALLQIEGAIPAEMSPQTVCGDSKIPEGGKLFGFGYPLGKVMSPLDVTFSSVDAGSGRWNVSGLFADGMSGGPVLDSYGNAIAVLSGGTVDDNGHIYALRTIAPIDPILTADLASRVAPVCGAVTPPNFQSLESNPQAGMKDTQSCGVGIPDGFTSHLESDNGSVLVIEQDRKRSFQKYRVNSLENSAFRISLWRIALPQFGMKNGEFARSKDVLACTAASRWFRQARQVNDPALQDASWKQQLNGLTGVSNDSEIASMTPQKCVDRSTWPSTFLAGNPPAENREIDFPGKEAARERLALLRIGSENLGSLYHLDIDGAARAGLVQALRDGKISDSALESYYGMRYLIESDIATTVPGLRASCSAYSNMTFGAFKDVCHTLLGRVLSKATENAVDCLLTPVGDPGWVPD